MVGTGLMNLYFLTGIPGDSDQQPGLGIIDVLDDMQESIGTLRPPDNADIAARILPLQAEDLCSYLTANCVFLDEDTKTIVPPFSWPAYGLLWKMKTEQGPF